MLRAGRVLRAMLQHESPHMIADRKHHLRVYRRSMVGAELVDWLVHCVPSLVRSRSQAVGVWQALLEEGVIVHGTRYRQSRSVASPGFVARRGKAGDISCGTLREIQGLVHAAAS